jgi:hypothetical protein
MVSNNLSRSADDRDPIVTRAHAEAVLQRVGWTPEEIAAVLDGLDLPDRLSRCAQQAAQYGITPEMLMDRLGGSP